MISARSLLLRVEKWAKAADVSFWALFGLCLIPAALLIVFFSQTGTPLHPYITSDTAVWSVIGRGITEGYVPYRDLYDHKGPLLIFIYAIGFFISGGKMGLCLLESVSVALVLAASFRLARLFVSFRQSWFILFFILLFQLATMDGGGTNELYSQVFMIWPFYWLMRALVKQSKVAAVPAWVWFSIGLAGGAVTMIRMNNSAALFGLSLGAVLLLLRGKCWLSVFKAAASMVGGLILALIPFCAYFMHHGAMEIFLQGCFLHNFSFAAEGVSAKTWQEYVSMAAKGLPALLVVALVLRDYAGRRTRGQVAFPVSVAGLLSYLILFVGNGYNHYVYIIEPLFVLLLSHLIRFFVRPDLASPSRRKAAYYRSSLCSLLLLTPFSMNMLSVCKACVSRNLAQLTQTGIELHYQACQKLGEAIPAADRDKVWGMDLAPDVYINMNVTPCYRYFTLQSFYSCSMPEIGDETTQWLKSSPPLYIVDQGNPAMKEVLNQRYECVETVEVNKGGSYSLYRRKE